MRNHTIDNLRGICMLGVIAIHIGSLALAPNNFPLYVILEVLSRYSVPSFFFISGYGLFCNLNKQKYDYFQFIKKRFKSSGIPYISWSLLYLFYFWLILPPGYISWNPLNIAYTLFFGLGCYHLYFMVILLWFYFTFPLWKYMISKITRQNIIISLTALFIFQLAFNYWTTHPGINADELNVVVKSFFIYRLNYLPLHYLLIFILGGLTAIYYDDFKKLLGSIKTITAIYITSIIVLLYNCYNSFYNKGYSLLDLANTYHQLSPEGLIYTVTSILFFCTVLLRIKTTSFSFKVLDLLSSNSLLIYLLHPLILDIMTSFYSRYGIVMTVKKVIFSYVLLVILSLLASIALTRLLTYNDTAAKLLIGKPNKQKR